MKERSFDKKCGYKYEYNGYEYEHYDKGYYLFFKARKGETCKLYINPDEPKEVYTPLDIAVTRDLIILGIGCVLAIWSFN